MNDDGPEAGKAVSARAAEKQHMRDQDELRLERGEVSASELQRENLAFRKARGPIRIRKRGGSGFLWLSLGKPARESKD